MLRFHFTPSLFISWFFFVLFFFFRKEIERAIDCADRALALAPNLESAQKLIVSRKCTRT